MFVIYCDNKKCGKSQEPLLDKETNEVFCTECGEIINNVTDFAKASMKSMSQFKRIKKQEAFAVKCQKCLKVSTPKLKQEVLACPHCNNNHDSLQAPYVHAIKQYLKNNKNFI